jgi:hypothetical protein
MEPFYGIRTGPVTIGRRRTNLTQSYVNAVGEQ